MKGRGELHAAFLGGWQAEGCVFQLGRCDHIRALCDGFREQAASRRRCHQVHDAQSARGFAGDGHVGRISAEGADVLLNPFEPLDLIEQCVIAGYSERRLFAQLRMRQPAEDTQPKVDRDHDDALAGKLCAVIQGVPARTRSKSASVYPEKDRRIARIGGSPDIQRQAVLAHRHRNPGVDALARVLRLEACGSEFGRFFDAGPPRHRAGRFPAARADRGQRIRDAFENAQIAFHLPLDRAGRRLNDRTVFAIG